MPDHSLRGPLDRLDKLTEALKLLKETEYRIAEINAQVRNIRQCFIQLENLGFTKGGEEDAEGDD